MKLNTRSTLVARAISSPIQELTKAVKEIAEGNLSVRIKVVSEDEVGRLAKSFNTMAEKLQGLYENLEQKFEERTMEMDTQVKELDKIAKLLVRRDFELMQVNEKLQDMDQAKSRFVSIAAHQLRTPMSGIKWTLHMLVDGDFGKVTKAQSKVMRGAILTVNRLVELVRDLLDVARIEEGRFAYQFSKFSMENVCESVYSAAAENAVLHGVSFTLSLPKTPLPLVSGDREHIIIVVQNLVDNAIKYTRLGGKAELSLKKHPNDEAKALVEVRDTGIGIPEQQIKLIGEKFFRADNVVKEKFSGTGLGLYMVKSILVRHGTELMIESKEGEGSVFSFTLSFVSK